MTSPSWDWAASSVTSRVTRGCCSSPLSTGIWTTTTEYISEHRVGTPPVVVKPRILNVGNFSRELQHLRSRNCVDQSTQPLHSQCLPPLSHVRGNELGKQAGPGSFSAKQSPSNKRPLMTSYLYNKNPGLYTEFRVGLEKVQKQCILLSWVWTRISHCLTNCPKFSFYSSF